MEYMSEKRGEKKVSSSTKLLNILSSETHQNYTVSILIDLNM